MHNEINKTSPHLDKRKTLFIDEEIGDYFKVFTQRFNVKRWSAHQHQRLSPNEKTQKNKTELNKIK